VTWLLSTTRVAHDHPRRPATVAPARPATEEAPIEGSYDIHLDDKYGHLALIDVAAEAASHEPWFNQTLTTVNDSVVRLGVIDGDFHWHEHEIEQPSCFDVAYRRQSRTLRGRRGRADR
jgi:hypothetical protein